MVLIFALKPWLEAEVLVCQALPKAPKILRESSWVMVCEHALEPEISVFHKKFVEHK